MKDEIIDLNGSSIAQRRMLGELIESLGGNLYLGISRICEAVYPLIWGRFSIVGGEWCGVGEGTTITITLKDFLKKYEVKPKYSLGEIYER